MGRDLEIAEMRGRLLLARGGEGQVVVVDGAVGTGRSTLAARAAELARDAGMRVATARCGWDEADAPYVCVGQLGARPIDPADHSSAATVAVATQLLASPGDDGLCLIVDDAQWADEPSLRVLLQVARRAQDRPMLLVLTATAEAAAPGAAGILDELRALPGTALLAVGPLGTEEAAALAAQVLDSPLDGDACARLVAHTGGNPLLMSELLRDMAAHGSDAPNGAVPERVRAAVTARLSRLGDDATAFARALHVLGGDTPLQRTIALAELDRAAGEEAADLLATAGICTPGSAPAFTVPLLDAAVGTAFKPYALDRWHRRAAALLDAEGAPAGAIARHLMQTAPAGEPWVVRPLREAAEEASARADLRETTRLLTRALAEPPAPEVVPSLLSDLAFAESRAGSPDAVARIQAAMAAAESREARVLLRREQTRLMWLTGRVPDAVACAELAVADAEPGTDLHEQVLSELLAVASMHDLATIYDRPALVDLLDRARTGWVPPSPALAATLATVLPFVLGDHRLVPPLADRALTEYLWRQDAPPFGMRPDFVIGSLWIADALERADAIVQEGMGIATENGDAVRLGLLHYWRGAIRYDAGDLAGAIAAATYATDPSHGSFQTWLGHSAATMAHAHLDRGDVQRARDAVAMTEGRVDPGQMAGIDADVARARLDLRGGDTAAALALACDVGERLTALGHGDGPTIVWRLIAARAALDLGDDADARRLVDEEVRIARATHATGRLGRALRAAAAMSEPDERLERLEEACAVLARTPRRLERARALLALGRELHARDDVPAARAALAEARELAEACGAGPVAAGALAGLHATGARPRRTARSGPHALTGAERRVVELAASGLTNREIGEQLMLAARTVEWHLGRAFAKLGVTSRRDLGAVLDQA